MDKSLIRSEPFLGNTKTIIGDKSSDIVLETLGKVYIKFGNNLKLLNDLFSLIDKSEKEVQEDNSKIIIAGSFSELLSKKYPGDGYFGFSLLDSTLYISYNKKWIPVVNTSDFKTGNYVKKTGDSMTGQLEIRTNGAPLIVRSKNLVENFNSEYLGGYSKNTFAKKAQNEIISGSWAYTGKNTFKDITYQEGDLICSKSISSPEFASGFNGYGWKLDATTNTLTIDNLVVRKILNIYELVVNQMSATNGSLWVTNSAKCESAGKPEYYQSYPTDSVIKSLYPGNYYIVESGNDCILFYVYTNFDLDMFEAGYAEFGSDRLSYLKTYIENEIPDYTPDTSGDDYITIGKTALYKQYSNDMSNIKGANMLILDGQNKANRNLYTYYFGEKSNYRIVKFDDESFPLFKTGDLVRCQKYNDGNIKYYDAIVITYISENTYLLELSKSFNDNYSNTSDSGVGETSANTIAYDKTSTDTSTEEGKKEALGDIVKDDGIVQIGNIYNTDRQGSIYITSTDDQGPYLEVLDEVCRPDYSVLIPMPDFIKVYDGEYKGCYAALWDDPSRPAGAKNTSAVSMYRKDKILSTKNIGGNAASYALYGLPNSSCIINTTKEGEEIVTYHKPSKVRLGKLSGIYNPIFGDRQPYGFGLYGENVFLTGEFYLNNGTSMVKIANDHISLQNSYNATKITVTQLEKWANGEDGTGYSDLMSEESVKSMLRSSGLHLTTDNEGRGIAILYGDQVKILTGWDGENPEYAAIFQNGKILAERIDLGNLILQNGFLPDIGEFTEYSCKSYSYTESTVKSTKDIPNFPELNYNLAGTIVRANSEDTIPSTSATYTIESSDNPISMKFSVFCIKNNTTDTDFKIMEVDLNSGTSQWFVATCRRYCSVSVSYVDTSGKTHIMICKDSLKDMETYSDDILVEVDENLIDLNNFFGETFDISNRRSSSYPTGAFDKVIRKYNFSFSTIPSVTEYTIKVNGGIVRTAKFVTSDNGVQVEPVHIIDGVGLMIGNPSLYPSDITSISGTTASSGYNSYSEKFSNTGYNYSSIIKYSGVYTYITPEGILSGSSPDSYMQVTSEYFTASYGGNEFVVDTNGIRYRIKGGNWKNFN